MNEQGIRFEPTDPPDPEDFRVVPAAMRFAPLARNGRASVAGKISQTIRLDGKPVLPQPSSVLSMLLSPEEARDEAQMLLAVADRAEDLQRGSPGRPRRVELSAK